MQIYIKIIFLLIGTDADTHEPPVRPSKATQQERRIDIQPAEDEEGK